MYGGLDWWHSHQGTRRWLWIRRWLLHRQGHLLEALVARSCTRGCCRRHHRIHGPGRRRGPGRGPWRHPPLDLVLLDAAMAGSRCWGWILPSRTPLWLDRTIGARSCTHVTLEGGGVRVGGTAWGSGARVGSSTGAVALRWEEQWGWRRSGVGWEAAGGNWEAVATGRLGYRAAYFF